MPPQPSDNEIAAAYLRMWADNLGKTPEDSEDADSAKILADGFRAVADSIAAGNHIKWFSSNSKDLPTGVRIETPRPRDRAQSAPHASGSGRRDDVVTMPAP